MSHLRGPVFLAASLSVLLVCQAAPAFAHRQNLSYLELTPAGRELTIALDIDPHDLADGRTLEASAPLSKLYPSTLLGPCAQDGPVDRRFLSDLGLWHLTGHWRCSENAAAVSVVAGYLDDMADGHHVLARISSAETLHQQMLSRDENVLQARGLVLDLSRFTILGVRHIFSGIDHLAFVLGLLLSATSLTVAVWVLSSFTLAHSLTLLIAGLGWLQVPERIVETGIALTIVAVGLESFRRRTDWHSLASLAFVFGLVHGLGFASALQEARYTHRALLASLFSFNIGIELGQLALVALTLPALLALKAERIRPIHLLGLAGAPLLLYAAGEVQNATWVALLVLASVIWCYQPARRRFLAPLLASGLVLLGTVWAVMRAFLSA